MSAKIVTTISLAGPFFDQDPTIPYSNNVRVMLEAMGKEGEADIKAQLEAGEGGRAPLAGGRRVSQYVLGRAAALSGKDWWQNAVISPDRSGLGPQEAIGLYAAASRIEGASHVFRRTATRLRASRVVNAAELTKGL